jgi:hypothetical protein
MSQFADSVVKGMYNIRGTLRGEYHIKTYPVAVMIAAYNAAVIARRKRTGKCLRGKVVIWKEREDGWKVHRYEQYKESWEA